MCMYSNIRHILGVTHLIKVKHDTDVWYIIFCHTVRSNEWDSIFYVSVVGRHQNFELPRIDSLSLHAVELAEFKEAHWFCAVYLSCDRVGIEFHQWINSFYKWHPLWFWGTVESDARLTLLYHILAKEFFPSTKTLVSIAVLCEFQAVEECTKGWVLNPQGAPNHVMMWARSKRMSSFTFGSIPCHLDA